MFHVSISCLLSRSNLLSLPGCASKVFILNSNQSILSVTMIALLFVITIASAGSTATLCQEMRNVNVTDQDFINSMRSRFTYCTTSTNCTSSTRTVPIQLPDGSSGSVQLSTNCSLPATSGAPSVPPTTTLHPDNLHLRLGLGLGLGLGLPFAAILALILLWFFNCMPCPAFLLKRRENISENIYEL
eukprot:sb/3471299/